MDLETLKSIGIVVGGLIAIVSVIFFIGVIVQVGVNAFGMGLNEAAKRLFGKNIRVLGFVKVCAFLGLTVAMFQWVSGGLVYVFGFIVLLPALGGWLELLHGRPFGQLARDFEKARGLPGVFERLWILTSACVFVGVLIWMADKTGFVK